MTQEEKNQKFREQAKIVSLYILYLKGKMEEFPYTRRELKKALQTVLFAANKQQKYREYLYHKKQEEETIETARSEEDDGFDTRHLFPHFKN